MSKQKIKELASFFKISWTECLVFLLLLLPFILKVASNFLIKNSQAQDYLKSMQDSLLNELWYRLNTRFMADLVNFGLWIVIGAIVISLLTAAVTVIINLRNDISLSLFFVHPASFHQKSFWASTLFRRATKIAYYCLLTIYSFILLKGTIGVYETMGAAAEQVSPHSKPIILDAILLSCLWLLGWHMLAVFHRLFKALIKKI